MRRIVAFPYDGDRLLGTLDEAAGETGILIVSGGNEVRCGAHRGMAALSAQLAAAGVPVFRFDRRGVGDSEGDNRDWSSAAPDIAAALATFRTEQPQLRHVLGFGNCDAATALLLLPHDCDALVLANPWLGDEGAPLPPAAVCRRYLRQMRSPAAWRRLVTGGLSSALLASKEALRAPSKQPLAEQVAAALLRRPTHIVLANGDRTAQVFAAGVRLPPSVTLTPIDTASHSFAGGIDALAGILLTAVRDFRVT